MSSGSERAAQIANLDERLTALCKDYERVRSEGAANQQFLAANGYLFRAQIHLANAANDYRRGDDLERDVASDPGPAPGGRGRGKADRGPAGSGGPAEGAPGSEGA